jgi:hypothetical protein
MSSTGGNDTTVRRTPSGRKRPFADLSTKALEHADRRFGWALWNVIDQLPPASSSEERERREAVVDDAARWALRAALVLLLKRDSHAYRAAVEAARRYIRKRLNGEVVAFEVRLARGRKLPMEWALLPEILGVYESILATLQAAWNGPAAVLSNPRFLNRTGERFGDAQVIGTAKYFGTQQARRDAVLAAAVKMVPQDVLAYQPPKKKVDSWILLDSPSAVAHELMADFFNELRRQSPKVLSALNLVAVKGIAPRANFTAKSIRTIVGRARKQRREAAELTPDG